MRALKTIVILMGIVLVIGTGVLIWGVMRQIEQLGQSEQSDGVAPAVDTTQAVATPEIAPWGRVDLRQPSGTRVQSVTTAGDYIVLHLYTGAPGIEERLMVIEPGTGTLMGTVMIGP